MMGWCISLDGDLLTRMPFPALTILAPARDPPDPGVGGSEEALVHETATTEAIAEAAE